MTDAPTTAWGLGLATTTDDGTVLDVWFPEPMLGDPGTSSRRPSRPGSRRSPAATTYAG